MPYRVDIDSPQSDVLDILMNLGAIDIEPTADGIAAIIPDGMPQDEVAAELAGAHVTFSAAVGRDNNSVWLLSPRPANALRLIDSDAFGTGHHPTTALCLEAIEEVLTFERYDSVLDVGIGSGILALTALLLGVPRAAGLDTDADSLRVAAENARLNNFDDRLQLYLGGPEVVQGCWPLVVANVLAAPLIEMAPILVRRVGSRGRIVLSGIPLSVEAEVRQAYRHFGMQHFAAKTRGGWVMLTAQASW